MIKSLARMASTASTRIFRHQSSDLSDGDEQPATMDAHCQAISFMERGQWDKFGELLLSAKQADEKVWKGRKGRRNGRRNRKKGAGGAESSGRPAHQMYLPSHDLLRLDSDGSTLLHALVMHHPPVSVVRVLHGTYPSMIRSVDSSGRTPLHWAVECVSLDVVDILLELYAPAADTMDCQGRTPLIQACVQMGSSSTPAAQQKSSNSAVGRETGFWYATELIRRLARSSSRSVLVEDQEGRTALEYAIDALAPRNTVRELQRATVTTLLEDKFEEERRRLSDHRRLRGEVQKQPRQQQVGWTPPPQYEVIGAAATSGIRMVATSA